MVGRCAAVFLASSTLAACTTPPVRAALERDLTQLKAEVRQAGEAGKLDASSTRDLARAVLARELASLRAPEDEFPPVDTCAGEVRGVLEELAEAGGDFAGAAGVTLIEAGYDAPSGGGHTPVAVAARTALGGASAARRRAYLLHGDVEVRWAALRAAAASADRTDTRALLEAARLDPNSRARQLAVRALARLGGEDVVLGLVDVWQGASHDLRLEIISAWAAPPNLATGGERELVNVAESAPSELQVAAAVQLERRSAGPPALSTRVLLDALGGSDDPAQRRALRFAPWQNPELRAAIREAASSDNSKTRLLASLRLVEHGQLEAPERERLAQTSEAEAEAAPALATLARALLARAGDARGRAALSRDVTEAAAGDQRMLAALGLAWLDAWAAAARALADDSPEVRRRVACEFLTPEDGAGEEGRRELFGPLAPDLLALVGAAPGLAARAR